MMASEVHDKLASEVHDKLASEVHGMLELLAQRMQVLELERDTMICGDQIYPPDYPHEPVLGIR